MGTTHKRGLFRLLAGLIAALLLLGMMAITAMAEETEPQPAPEDTSASAVEEEEVPGEDLTEGEEEEAEPDIVEMDQEELELDDEAETEEPPTASPAMLDSADHTVNTLNEFMDALDLIEQSGLAGSILVTTSIELPGTVEIPAGVDVSISSDTGSKGFTMAASCENERHFRVFATLRLQNIMIVGRLSNSTTHAPGTGGVHVDGSYGKGVLELYDGTQIGNCSVSVLSWPVSYPTQGGGVFLGNGATMNMHGGDILLNETQFRYSIMSGVQGGGGVGVHSGSVFNMYGGTIQRNVANLNIDEAVYGGGVLASGDFNMYGGEIWGNMVGGYGGGVALQASSANMSGPKEKNFYMHNDATIRNNTASAGGGLFMYGGMDFYMNGGHIKDNTAYFMGGGIYTMNYCDIHIDGGTLTGNSVPGGLSPGWEGYGGGAIYFSGNTSSINSGYNNLLNIKNATISGNSTAFNGGAIYMSDGRLHTYTTIESTTITGNHAEWDGGGIFLINALGTATFKQLVLDETYFARNTAGNGALRFDVDDAEYEAIHNDKVNVTGLSSPFDHTSSDDKYNKAYNNFDITYPNGLPLTYHEVRFYVDSVYVGSEYALEGYPVREHGYTPGAGLVLRGWYEDDGTFLSKWDFDTLVSGPMSLYAYTESYTPAVSNVYFHRNYTEEDTDILHTVAGVTEGDPVPGYTPAGRTGYTMVGWGEEHYTGIFWDFTTGTMPDDDLHLYAQWRINRHTATFDYSQVFAAPNNTKTQNADYNARLTDPGSAASGYTFKGWWYAAGNKYWHFASDKMPDKNITLVGVWEKNETPPPSSSSDGGGTITPPEESSSSSTGTGRSRSASVSASGASASQSGEVSPSAAPVSSVSQPPQSVSEPEGIDLDSENIGDDVDPLANWWTRTDGWSLLNVILSALLFLSAILQLVLMLAARRKTYSDGSRQQAPKSKALWQLLCAVTSVAAVILLLVLENFTGTMLILNLYSPIFLALAILHAAFAAVAVTRKSKWTQAE